MKAKYITLIIVLMLSAITSYTSAQNTIAMQADSAYNKEDYAEATRLYNISIANEGPSSNIYYNLGNAYYRNNNLGRSILSYERALKIDPSNEKAQTNLAFVKTKIQDIPEDDSSFLSNLNSSITASLSPNTWSWLAMFAFVIMLSSIGLYIFSSNVRWRKTGFFGGIVVAIIFLYLFITAWQTSNGPTEHNEAIVVEPTTNLCSAPRSTRSKTEKVVPIHEGTKIEILDSISTPDDPNVGKWYDAKINNSSRGWLNADDVEKI